LRAGAALDSAADAAIPVSSATLMKTATSEMTISVGIEAA
jgi:hypothetical protein